ncbi:SRPBCC domain-containing protein [Dyadobacter sp. 676]|uniref:SRPBCC domain-containing protein n=1 Tax=Dyadobacter sp. 676 TaxID=3088362 RepID=A0AAU8FIF7_9BACT
MVNGVVLSSTDQLAKLPSKTLKLKTGRDWTEWIDWLDSHEATTKEHKQIVAILADQVESAWYRQKIASGYREARGLRALGELSSGYEVGVTKTVPVPAAKAWEMITSGAGLAVWLGNLAEGKIARGQTFRTKDGITGTITVLEPGSHLRMAWKPENWRGSSTLQVRVTGSRSKHAGKSVISFHQEKLPDATDREEMKAYWEEKLSRLTQIIKGK